MKNGTLVELVCAGHCEYYRPGKKEEQECRGFTLAGGLLPKLRAGSSLPVRPDFPQSSTQRILMDLLCGTCDFRVDGCDFIEQASEGVPLSRPCGGFLFLGGAIDRGLIEEDELRGVR